MAEWSASTDGGIDPRRAGGIVKGIAMDSEVSARLPLQARPSGQHATVRGTRSAKAIIKTRKGLFYWAHKRFEQFGIHAYHR
jgi:hypothetical protein